jgi:hypothetical protein
MASRCRSAYPWVPLGREAEINVAGARRQVQDCVRSEAAEKGARAIERNPIGLALRPDACAKAAQSGCEPLEVLRLVRWDYVDVHGCSGVAVKDRCHAADRHEVDR